MCAVRRFTYHLENDPTGAIKKTKKTCDDVVHTLMPHFRRQPNQAVQAPVVVRAPIVVPAPGTEPAFAPTEAALRAEWAVIAELGWRCVSVQVIDEGKLRQRLDAPKKARIKLAVQRVIDHECAGLNLKGVPFSTMVQIIALGREALVSSGKDRDDLVFIEKEIQAIDLAALLWQ